MLFSFVGLGTVDASTIQPVVHAVSSVNVHDLMSAGAYAFAAIPIAAYVKTNCSIDTDKIAELTRKYGKIKILSVVIEAPVYDDAGNITDPGEIYYFAVKRPDLGTVRMMTDYIKNDESDKYINSFINNCIVAGDLDKVKGETADGIVWLGLASKVDEYLKPYGAFLDKA